jgi:hypothetical protein
VPTYTKYTLQGLMPAKNPELAAQSVVALPVGGPTGVGGPYAQGMCVGLIGGDVAGTDHKLTVDLASVFHAPDTGAQEIELVRERARERAKDGKPSDPVADFKELRRLREEARAKRWSGVQVDCDTTTRISDPFDVLAVTAGREPTWFRGKRPTEKMNKILLDAGLPPAEVSQMTFWKARSMIKVIIDRSEKGYCSYKMVALLRKYGVDATTMSFEDAGAEIEAIKAAGWKRG